MLGHGCADVAKEQRNDILRCSDPPESGAERMAQVVWAGGKALGRQPAFLPRSFPLIRMELIKRLPGSGGGENPLVADPVPTKNSVRVDFLDFSGRGQVAFRR